MGDVSFGSNYVLRIKNSKDYDDVKNLKQSIKENIKYDDEGYNAHIMPKRQNAPGYGINAVIVDDNAAFNLERYCALKGIEYKKTDDFGTDKEILTARVHPNNKQTGKIFCNINATKLDELVNSIKDDEDFAGNLKKEYERSKSIKGNAYNKYGHYYNITPSSLHLKEHNGKITGGSFTEEPQAYFVLQKTGLKSIPVVLDDEATYNSCKKLDLLSK